MPNPFLSPLPSTAELRDSLVTCATLEGALATVLDASIALLRADFGNVQLYRGGELVIACHRGFKENFLKAFWRVSVEDDCACGRALREGRSIVIMDVTTDPGFAPFREIAAESGYRSVQSTPLITSSGSFVGMISTHFAAPRTLSKDEMMTMAEYATLLADAIQSFVAAALVGGSFT